jgi:hypothetical protein
MHVLFAHARSTLTARLASSHAIAELAEPLLMPSTLLSQPGAAMPDKNNA